MTYYQEFFFFIAGCVGGICALANAMGKELCDLQILYEQGKYDEALELQYRLIGPNTAVSFNEFPIM